MAVQTLKVDFNPHASLAKNPYEITKWGALETHPEICTSKYTGEERDISSIETGQREWLLYNSCKELTVTAFVEMYTIRQIYFCRRINEATMAPRLGSLNMQ